MSYITEDGEEQKLFRMTYSSLVARYQDERSMGFNPLTENEKYIFAYPVWRCKGQSHGKRGERGNVAVTIVVGLRAEFYGTFVSVETRIQRKERKM